WCPFTFRPDHSDHGWGRAIIRETIASLRPKERCCRVRRYPVFRHRGRGGTAMKYLRPACLALAFVAAAVAGERADFAHARRAHHHLSHHHTARTWTRSAVAPAP